MKNLLDIMTSGLTKVHGAKSNPFPCPEKARFFYRPLNTDLSCILNRHYVGNRLPLDNKKIITGEFEWTLLNLIPVIFPVQ